MIWNVQLFLHFLVFFTHISVKKQSKKCEKVSSLHKKYGKWEKGEKKYPIIA